MTDIERGRAVVRSVLFRVVYLEAFIAALGIMRGDSIGLFPRIVRVLVFAGICILVYQRYWGWLKWFVTLPVIGFLLGTATVMAVNGIDAWALTFFLVGLLYAVEVSRLWRDQDAVAFLAVPREE